MLTAYDATASTKVASRYGLGAVLLQMSNGVWKSVAYASRSMTETDRCYPEIEKEGLAVTWACERFSDYNLGLSFQTDTDDKPLVPLLVVDGQTVANSCRTSKKEFKVLNKEVQSSQYKIQGKTKDRLLSICFSKTRWFFPQ